MDESACFRPVMLPEKFCQPLSTKVVKNPRREIDGGRLFQSKRIRHDERARQFLGFGQAPHQNQPPRGEMKGVGGVGSVSGPVQHRAGCFQRFHGPAEITLGKGDFGFRHHAACPRYSLSRSEGFRCPAQ